MRDFARYVTFFLIQIQLLHKCSDIERRIFLVMVFLSLTICIILLFTLHSAPKFAIYNFRQGKPERSLDQLWTSQTLIDIIPRLIGTNTTLNTGITTLVVNYHLFVFVILIFLHFYFSFALKPGAYDEKNDSFERVMY